MNEADEKRIAELEEILGFTTPEPWEMRGLSQRSAEVYAPCPCCGLIAKGVFPWDAVFIARARSDVPWLISIVNDLKMRVPQRWAFCFGCKYLYDEERADVAEAMIKKLEARLLKAEDVVEAVILQKEARELLDIITVAENYRYVTPTEKAYVEQRTRDADRAMKAALDKL